MNCCFFQLMHASWYWSVMVLPPYMWLSLRCSFLQNDWPILLWKLFVHLLHVNERSCYKSLNLTGFSQNQMSCWDEFFRFLHWHACLRTRPWGSFIFPLLHKQSENYHRIYCQNLSVGYIPSSGVTWLLLTTILTQAARLN